MTSEGVQTILSGDTMVKAVNRKPRTFQTPGEKIYSLEEHDTRLRERLLLVNRFEDARLERLQRQITSNERANIGRILRRKDQTRLTLINIASTKRKLQTNVGAFERRLKNGTNSPIFSVELDRVRRREQELSSLRLKLQAPNSQLLAAHVRDELRNIESRLDANPSRLTNSTNPSSVAGSYAHVTLIDGKDTETSLVTSNSEKMIINDNLEDLVDEVHTKMSQTNISPPKSQTPVHEVQETHFPLTQPAAEQNQMPDDQPKHLFVLSAAGEDKPLNSKLEDIPEKPEDIPENKVVPVEIPKQELPPLRVTRNKKQKYLSLMQQKLVRTSIDRNQEISHSALRRERHALQRMAELKVKTREDIQGRRTADSEDSLGSIKQQEVVTRLKTSRKDMGIPQLPSVRTHWEEHEKRTKPRDFSRAQRKRPSGKRRVTDSSTAAIGVKLPPLRIDNGILKELKESRLRHRHQSKKLPKLP